MNKIFYILMLMPLGLLASNIKGKVTDQKGVPVPGVNVFWLHTTSGTVSDANGDFQLLKLTMLTCWFSAMWHLNAIRFM